MVFLRNIFVVCGVFSLSTSCMARRTTSENFKLKEATTSPKSKSDSGGLDVNDVSILFPLFQTKEENRKLLGLEEKGLFSEILNRKSFQFIAKKAKEKGLDEPEFSEYERWKIVAMRFDPCTNLKGFSEINTMEDFDKCLPLFKLVAQPIIDDSRFPELKSFDKVGDKALHLIYAVQKSEQKDFILNVTQRLKDLKKISRKSTNYTLLGPHPGMVGAAEGPEMAAAKRIITDFSGMARLNKVAFFSLGNPSLGKASASANNWIFMDFDVNQQTKTLSEPLPVHQGKDRELFFSDNVVQKNDLPIVDPIPENFNETALLMDKKAMEGTVLFPKSSPEYKNAVKVLDPREFTQISTTCVNCHRASPVLTFNQRISEPFSVANLFNPFELNVPRGLTVFSNSLNLSKDAYQLRNFGFLARDVNISNRTIIESGHIADVLNRVVLKEQNPSPLPEACDTNGLQACAFVGTEFQECLLRTELKCKPDGF